MAAIDVDNVVVVAVDSAERSDEILRIGFESTPLRMGEESRIERDSHLVTVSLAAGRLELMVWCKCEAANAAKRISTTSTGSRYRMSVQVARWIAE